MSASRFNTKETEKLYRGERVRQFSGKLALSVQNKLIRVVTSPMLDDLHFPPGNHLEKLSGNRAGQWSIRINDQWRICFEWRNGMAVNIEVVDYH